MDIKGWALAARLLPSRLLSKSADAPARAAVAATRAPGAPSLAGLRELSTRLLGKKPEPVRCAPAQQPQSSTPARIWMRPVRPRDVRELKDVHACLEQVFPHNNSDNSALARVQVTRKPKELAQGASARKLRHDEQRREEERLRDMLAKIPPVGKVKPDHAEISGRLARKAETLERLRSGRGTASRPHGSVAQPSPPKPVRNAGGKPVMAWEPPKPTKLFRSAERERLNAWDGKSDLKAWLEGGRTVRGNPRRAAEDNEKPPARARVGVAPREKNSMGALADEVFLVTINNAARRD
jgi:hypothetical protein